MAQPFVTKTAADHGTHIFVYNNIRTNQVVYSLTRSLNNHASLKQLPFLGKKTVPATLRRDLWTPLCALTFLRPQTGLLAYRRLRELRRLHETSYDLSIITETSDGPKKGQLMSTKKRGKVLMNQKANSVADMAAVLLMQEKGPSEEEEVVHEGLAVAGYTAAWPEMEAGSEVSRGKKKPNDMEEQTKGEEQRERFEEAAKKEGAQIQARPLDRIKRLFTRKKEVVD
ncbi:MAG: hypothetical protein Q9190_005095 [Brigantiaea leucoxantha]